MVKTYDSSEFIILQVTVVFYIYCYMVNVMHTLAYSKIIGMSNAVSLGNFSLMSRNTSYNKL